MGGNKSILIWNVVVWKYKTAENWNARVRHKYLKLHSGPVLKWSETLVHAIAGYSFVLL